MGGHKCNIENPLKGLERSAFVVVSRARLEALARIRRLRCWHTIGVFRLANARPIPPEDGVHFSPATDVLAFCILLFTAVQARADRVETNGAD